MPYELFLALRYLRSRRKRRLARVTTAVAILGICVGVAALVAALALANGFRDEMREKILSGTSHINVMRADGQPITDYRELSTRIKGIAGVVNAAGTSYEGAVLIGPRGSTYAVLRGIDKEAQTFSDGGVIAGSVAPLFDVNTQLPAVLLGAELADRTGLHVGDTAEIISANASLSSLTPVKRSVRIAGIFRAGLFEYDSSWIYLSLDTVSQFSQARDSAPVISVQLTDIYTAKQIAANIRTALGPTYSTVDWEETNRPLFNALALERRMGAVVIALIILIASLNITTTLILVVVDRRHDIGVLRTLGATSRGIMMIFMIEGAIIGAIGAIAGVLLGALACFVGNRYQLVSLPADVYSITNVPFHTQPSDVALAATAAFLLSLAATIYPARAATRVRPVEILRDEN
ncbi:MAG TPA: ABC transporter permease [Pyrinomonadaceae bacterium]|nr:ABC transporter permease [Pyrinomonadaceae bacterium]